MSSMKFGRYQFFVEIQLNVWIFFRFWKMIKSLIAPIKIGCFCGKCVRHKSMQSHDDDLRE